MKKMRKTFGIIALLAATVILGATTFAPAFAEGNDSPTTPGDFTYIGSEIVTEEGEKIQIETTVTKPQDVANIEEMEDGPYKEHLENDFIPLIDRLTIGDYNPADLYHAIRENENASEKQLSVNDFVNPLALQTFFDIYSATELEGNKLEITIQADLISSDVAVFQYTREGWVFVDNVSVTKAENEPTSADLVSVSVINLAGSSAIKKYNVTMTLDEIAPIVVFSVPENQGEVETGVVLQKSFIPALLASLGTFLAISAFTGITYFLLRKLDN